MLIRSNCKPEYPHTHSGTILVVGTSQTMMSDFNKAKSKRPDAVIMGVNRTGQFLHCDMLVSQDRGLTNYWRSVSLKSDPEYHGLIPKIWPFSRFPAIDYFWPTDAGSGTSAWFGAKIARAIGFEEIILCGVSLEPGPYADGVAAKTFDNLKSCRFMRERMVLDTWMREYVSGVSGWVRQEFGYIKGEPQGE